MIWFLSFTLCVWIMISRASFQIFQTPGSSAGILLTMTQMFFSVSLMRTHDVWERERQMVKWCSIELYRELIFSSKYTAKLHRQNSLLHKSSFLVGSLTIRLVVNYYYFSHILIGYTIKIIFTSDIIQTKSYYESINQIKIVL